MKRKSILALILVTMLAVSISLIGCGRKYSNSGSGNGTNPGTDGTMRSDINGASNSVKNGIDATGNALNYTAANFKDDFSNAGYKLKDSANSIKNYFTGNETDYLAGNDVVRVYEYGSKNDLESDISRIAPNGLTVSGSDANYTRKPNYYRKGNSLIVYEGNEPAYTDHFKTMYGNPIIP